jgi:hypothetical protein
MQHEAVVTYTSVHMHWFTVTTETCESSDLWPGVHSNNGKPVIVRQFTRWMELNLTMFTNKIRQKSSCDVGYVKRLDSVYV